MTFIIPMWLIWMICTLLGIIIFFLAIIGAYVLCMFMKSDCHLGWFG